MVKPEIMPSGIQLGDDVIKSCRSLRGADTAQLVDRLPNLLYGTRPKRPILDSSELIWAMGSPEHVHAYGVRRNRR
jgi:hypothetical protein